MKTLAGRRIDLVPMDLDHIDPLFAVSAPELFAWYPTPPIGRDAMETWVRTALEWREAGTAEPFVIRLREGGQIIGSTRFANIVREHRRLEIGWTWVAKPWQRTFVNTEAKLLLLTEAFEAQHMLRVELKTDALNAQSRAAILRLGAKEEGTLRRHTRTSTGRQRDTVYYSILVEEWPEVRARLIARSTSWQSP